MKKFLVPFIKLLLVAGLMYFVFSNISLVDRLIVTAPGGATTVTEGKVIGPWDKQVVQFLEAGESEPTEVVITTDSLEVEFSIVTYWRNMSVPWLLLGALCYLLSVGFASTRWWWLLTVNKLPISFWSAYRFTWIGIFFNNVVPGQTGGDLVKAIYVMKRCHGARVPAMMSVVVDRIMGLASLSLLAAVSVLFYLSDPEFVNLAIVLWGVLGMVILFGIVAFSRRVRSLIRLKQLLDRLPDKIGHLLKRIDHAVFFYRQHKKGMALWLFGGIFNHISSVCSYACVGISLGVGMPFGDYFVLIPVIVTVSAIPLAPNGWGVGELLFKELFGRFGAVHLLGNMSKAAAIHAMGTRGVALSIVYRLHLTAWSMLGGVMYFLDKDKVSRKEMAEEVEREEIEEAAFDEQMAAEDRA